MAAVRILPALMDVGHVEDVLHDMTDGSFYVIGLEVFDAPGVVGAATAAQARRFDCDEGNPLGIWVLGRADDVYVHIKAQGWTEFEERFAYGCDPDG